MKFSKASIAVIIIGVVLIILAPVWRWAIAPQFIKVPDDLNITSVYEGTLTLYANPQKMTLLPEGQEEIVPLTITRKDTSVPTKSNSNVAVVREQVAAKAPNGDVVISWDRYFAMDRKGGNNVAGNNSDMDRTGYYIMLPMGAGKKTYQIWDDDLKKTGSAVFLKEITLNGKKHKNVKVYVLNVKGAYEKMATPPLGLPAELPGSQVKQILGNPNLAIPDATMIAIDYYKKTDAELVAEPRTGAFVNIPKYHEEYAVNAALPGQPPNYMKLAVLEYKQSSENVSVVIDDTAKYFGLLDLVTLWLPLIFLVVGLILMIVGFFLGRRPAAMPDTMDVDRQQKQ